MEECERLVQANAFKLQNPQILVADFNYDNLLIRQKSSIIMQQKLLNKYEFIY